jgi:FkbM family methyltransferase
VRERNNVTLFNAAVSDAARVVGLRIPSYESGLRNYYRAHICDAPLPEFAESLAITLDQLTFGHPIKLVKIDVEGHEAAVLAGMCALLNRDMPTLILETESDAIREDLAAMGYMVKRLPGSPNLLCRMDA